MAKEPKCLVCAEPATTEAVKALRSQGLSMRDIAARVKRSKTSIERHLKHADGPARPTPRSRRRAQSQAGHDVEGRCKLCGTLLDDPSPPALVKRSERLLWLAETTAAQAKRDDDSRLMLQAVDRGQRSLDQLLKVHNLLQPDGVTVNVAIDSRRSLEVWLGGLSETQLRRLSEMLSSGIDLAALVTTFGAEPSIECNADATRGVRVEREELNSGAKLAVRAISAGDC